MFRKTGCTKTSQLGFEPDMLLWWTGSPPTKQSGPAPFLRNNSLTFFGDFQIFFQFLFQVLWIVSHVQHWLYCILFVANHVEHCHSYSLFLSENNPPIFWQLLLQTHVDHIYWLLLVYDFSISFPFMNEEFNNCSLITFIHCERKKPSQRTKFFCTMASQHHTTCLFNLQLHRYSEHTCMRSFAANWLKVMW